MISNSVIRLVMKYIFIVYICIFGLINIDNLFYSIYILYKFDNWYHNTDKTFRCIYLYIGATKVVGMELFLKNVRHKTLL